MYGLKKNIMPSIKTLSKRVVKWLGKYRLQAFSARKKTLPGLEIVKKSFISAASCHIATSRLKYILYLTGWPLLK